MARRYAEGTKVGIGRSREQITELLRKAGASGVMWRDDWEAGKVSLFFLWRVDAEPTMPSRQLQARLEFKVPTDEYLRRACTVRGRFAEAKFKTMVKQRGAREHRVLHLWLKAAFEAVELGLTRPEVIFLPYIEDADGRTVADVLVPHLHRLPTISTSRMLVSGK